MKYECSNQKAGMLLSCVTSLILIILSRFRSEIMVRSCLVDWLFITTHNVLDFMRTGSIRTIELNGINALK